MLNFKLLITIVYCFTASSAVAGTILLMGIGLGTPGGVGPGCSNSLDFTDSCNSQYFTVF